MKPSAKGKFQQEHDGADPNIRQFPDKKLIENAYKSNINRTSKSKSMREYDPVFWKKVVKLAIGSCATRWDCFKDENKRGDSV